MICHSMLVRCLGLWFAVALLHNAAHAQVKGNDLGSACVSQASSLNKTMQNPPDDRWKAALASPLGQIQSQGLAAFIREHGGASGVHDYFAKLTASMLQTAANGSATYASSMLYGTGLAGEWDRLLNCIANDLPAPCAGSASVLFPFMQTRPDVSAAFADVRSTGLTGYIQGHGGVTGTREHLDGVFASMDPGVVTVLNPMWNEILKCMSNREAPDGPCAAAASRALELMQSPPPGWKNHISAQLRRIRSVGLNAYIRESGGISKLLASTRADLTAVQQSSAKDPYGISLNQAWIDMLDCMSHHERSYESARSPKDLVSACDAAGEISERCADAYIAYANDPFGDAADSGGRLQGEPLYRKALRIREQISHTDQSLAQALELEGKTLKSVYDPVYFNALSPAERAALPPNNSQDLLDRALPIRKKSVLDLNAPEPQTGRSGAPNDGTVYRVGAGATAPVAVQRTGPASNPNLSQSLHASGCTVTLYFVVETSGQTSGVSLLKSCGLGLDEEAARAALKWRFRPGTKAGVPVRVELTADFKFGQ